MKRPVLFVDHPLLAEGFAAFLRARKQVESSATATALDRLPPHALVLVEIELPQGGCGLSLAARLLRERPDLTPIVWTIAPIPLYSWAATRYRLPAMLDKTMEPTEFLYWLEVAADHSTAWPLPLLTAAREWGDNVAPRLRSLKPVHWDVWLALVRGSRPDCIAPQLSLSKRTVQRRLDELQQLVGAEDRQALVPLAWQWGLATRNDDVRWASIVHALLELRAAGDAGDEVMRGWGENG